jgi:hypothetical protein
MKIFLLFQLLIKNLMNFDKKLTTRTPERKLKCPQGFFLLKMQILFVKNFN